MDEILIFFAVAGADLVGFTIAGVAEFGGRQLFTQEAVSMGVVIGIMGFARAYAGKWILGRILEAVFPKIINVLVVPVGILFVIRG